jgi:hypothetical protein
MHNPANTRLPTVAPIRSSCGILSFVSAPAIHRMSTTIGDSSR